MSFLGLLKGLNRFQQSSSGSPTPSEDFIAFENDTEPITFEGDTEILTFELIEQ